MNSQKNSRHYLLLLILLLSYLSDVQCYKILINCPRMAHSHVNFFGHIADILVEAGHDVVMYMPEMDPDVKTNGTELARIIPGPCFSGPFSMNKLMRNSWTENAEDFVNMTRVLTADNNDIRVEDIFIYVTHNSGYVSPPSSGLVRLNGEIFRDFFKESRSKILKDKECSAISHGCLSILVPVGNEALMEQLRAEHFDFGITEVYSTCAYAIFYKIGLNNYASAFSTNLFEAFSGPFGVSSNPSYVPTIYSSNADVMNYWERVQNVFLYVQSYLLGMYMKRMVADEEVVRHLPNGFDAEEAMEKSSFAFVNSEELLDFPRLISHKIVYIGGIAVNKPKPLNQEYQKIVNESTNGVVLVSFGSIAKSSQMPSHIKNSFREAFRSFPEITFLWKYEVDDEYAADLPNVIRRKWLPQLDLLGHPNLRAFVSHCGENSLMESVHEAVPLICIPLFGDQAHNARVATRRNIGIYINKYDLSAEILKDALQKILYDESYRKASQRLLEMIRNKPISAHERLLRHIDFALKFGPIENFNLASNNLSFFQYYLLDIIAPVLLVLAAIVYLILRLFLRIVCKLLPLSKLKTE